MSIETLTADTEFLGKIPGGTAVTIRVLDDGSLRLDTLNADAVVVANARFHLAAVVWLGDAGRCAHQFDLFDVRGVTLGDKVSDAHRALVLRVVNSILDDLAMACPSLRAERPVDALREAVEFDLHRSEVKLELLIAELEDWRRTAAASRLDLGEARSRRFMSKDARGRLIAGIADRVAHADRAVARRLQLIETEGATLSSLREQLALLNPVAAEI